MSRSAEASEQASTLRFVARVERDFEHDDEWDSSQAIEGAIDSEHALFRFSIEDSSSGFGAMSAILAGHTLYLESSSFTEALGGMVGYPEMPAWLSVDLDEEEWGEMAAGEAFADPAQLFALLKNTSTSVTKKGTEDIRGIECTRYVVVLDSETITNSMVWLGAVVPPGEDAPMEATVEIWIDGSELIRRIAYSYEGESEDESAYTYRYDVEFFDYGQPIDLELPDPDEVMDMEELFASMSVGGELGGSTSWDEPFAGADCYGDLLLPCLEPNPALADLYGDPAACAGAEPRVCLVPVGFVRRDVVEAILAFHRETAGIDIVVLPSVPIDPANVDTVDSQGIAEPMFEDVRSAYRITDNGPSTYIGIASIDLRPEDGELGWFFGYRTGWDGRGHVHGMFSYFRMANVEPYDYRVSLDDHLLFQRAAKYTGRYVALLHLKWPMDRDPNYLNYYEIHGFGDLDSMQANWPEGEPPCSGEGPIICVAPDGKYWDDEFEADLLAVLPDLAAATGLKVEMYSHGGAYPTSDPWSEEYRNDLHNLMGGILEDPDVLVIGVTDDPFAEGWDRDRPIGGHITRAWPAERLAVASGYEAGTPGTPAHQERIFRLLLRAVQLAQGTPESSNPGHLLYTGLEDAADLDRVTAGLPYDE